METNEKIIDKHIGGIATKLNASTTSESLGVIQIAGREINIRIRHVGNQDIYQAFVEIENSSLLDFYAIGEPKIKSNDILGVETEPVYPLTKNPIPTPAEKVIDVIHQITKVIERADRALAVIRGD